MKAARFHAYGSPDMLHIEDVPRPVPGDGEVLIQVHASLVNFADLLVRNFREFSGVIARVGKNVRRFAPGDAVFGYCGPRMGADAEYLSLPETGFITRKPFKVPTLFGTRASARGGKAAEE